MVASSDMAAVETPQTEARRPTPEARLVSIDALRGFDMFWIIGGGEAVASVAKVWPNRFTLTLQAQLEHVHWEGFHFEDLIYPLFLFIIGIVLQFSLIRRRDKGQSPTQLYLHFLTRSLLLIVLGNIPGGLFTFQHWPFMGGVLSHIGLCYFWAAILIMHTTWRVRIGIGTAYLFCYWLASV